MNRTNNLSLPGSAGFLRLAVFFFTAMLLCCTACGRKALPLPPAAYVPPAANDVSGELVDGRVVLSWTLPAVEQDGRLPGGVVRIFRAERSLSATDGCPECPPAYSRVAEFPIRKMRPDAAGRLEGDFRQTVAPDNHYRYYLVVRSKDGIDGPPSADVEVMYPREVRP